MEEVLKAVSTAMGEVRKVAKGNDNTHDNYSFASIDDFLALVNPICAENGLIVFSDELSREDFMKKSKYGENAWMRATFSFTVYHTSGQSLPEMRRTVEVMRNGAQAYGSAQSYCLKQFLRGLFLIPTGDKDDADFEKTEPGEIVNNAPKRQPAPAIDPEAINIAKESMSNAESLEALRDIFTGLPKDVQRFAGVIATKDERKAALEDAEHDKAVREGNE